jgi:hypothetical protein
MPRSPERDPIELPEGQATAPSEMSPSKNPAAVALGKLGGKKGGPARARKLSPAERSEIAARAARVRWSRAAAISGPVARADAQPGDWKTFLPRLEILPPALRDLWPGLREAARLGFVLYGGTAIALRLGHRQSVDFDFFSDQPFDPELLMRRLQVLGPGLVLQILQDTFILSLESSRRGQPPVKVSFFTVGTGRVWEPERTQDGVAVVASMRDLLAHKLKVLLQRLELKDYLDIHAMVRQGYRLEDGLAGARAMFGRTFQPAEALKALTWFQGGNLHELPRKVQKELAEAVSQVGDLPAVPEVRKVLGGGGE